MKFKVLSCVLGFFWAVATGWSGPPPGYVLTWADEFDRNALDTTKWNAHEGRRFHAISTTNALSEHDGNLIITTYTEGRDNFSGFIDTKDTFEQTYGYFEARISFQTQSGSHSAFWLQSPTVGQVGDPAANGVETDIFEHRHSDKKGKIISNNGDSALHWDGYGANHKQKTIDYTNLAVASGFHTYGLLWTTNQYRVFIDGKLEWSVDAPISQRPEYIRLTSEVDRSDWSGKVPAGGYGDLSASTNKMTVDYVRVYAPAPVP